MTDPKKPSEGWAVELTGERIDLDDLREMLKPPFDPWVEDFEDEENLRLLLRSKAWGPLDDSSVVLEHAGRMVTRINGAKLVLQSDSLPVSLGAIFRFQADGTRQPIIIAATGHFMLRGCRMRGRATVISDRPPPPPQPSDLQNWIQAAETDDDRADLFEHLARAQNWYDIYKSAEIIRRIAGGKTALRKLLGAEWPEWNRVWRTANYNRHAPDPSKAPPVPATLEEARTALFGAARRLP